MRVRAGAGRERVASGAGELRMLVAGGVIRPALNDGGARADTEGLEGVLLREAALLPALEACCDFRVLLSMLLRHLLKRLAAFGVAKLVKLDRA